MNSQRHVAAVIWDGHNAIRKGILEMTTIVQSFRSQMPVTARWAYLNHASVAPLPKPSAAAIRRFADTAESGGTVCWPEWNVAYEGIRGGAATLIGADVEELARVRSTSEGLSVIANGFPWQAGDNVISFEDEFPSNAYPWMNLASRGVELRLLPMPELLGYTESAEDALDAMRLVHKATAVEEAILRRLDAAIDSKTRIVTLSWVGFRTGFRQNLDRVAELVHRRGVLLCVDGIQAMGVQPIHVRETPVDFLVADGHKLMLGPEGSGVLFLRREHFERIRPTTVGWASVEHCRDFDHFDLTWQPDARRFEHGSPNMLGANGWYPSLQLLAELGVENIHRAILEVTDYAVERLRSIGAVIRTLRGETCRSGIVLFSMPGKDSATLAAVCERAGVVLICRGSGLRISPHAYNNREDIDRMIDAIQNA